MSAQRRLAAASSTEGRSEMSAFRSPMTNFSGIPLAWPSSTVASHSSLVRAAVSPSPRAPVHP
eukprot:9639309-Lingulodinium_polyedra.AAC.1